MKTMLRYFMLTSRHLREGRHVIRKLLFKGCRTLANVIVLTGIGTTILSSAAFNQVTPNPHGDCRVQSVDYRGWQAQQVSNRWLQLVIVPQNGGRLMQVTFAGHPFLFVNPKLAGKYMPPTSARWFNYGGDKVWLLPEGNNDEEHWVGDSDVLDDGPFTFQKISEGKLCTVGLVGPADPQTGIQFARTISIEADSPVIHFHATMKNVTGHTLDWSMQSVSQYDTSNRGVTDQSGPAINHDFWAFTSANPASSYLNRYHVRFGPAENPAVSVRDDGLFALHYVHMAAELWVDSTDGWLAVVDGSSRYAMVERFQYEQARPYPGKASVIFWTNGPEARLNADGEMSLSKDPDASPYYLEAELNSPMCHLRAGESCNFDTDWFPTRAGTEVHCVSEAGILIRPLRATPLPEGKVNIAGTFGVFFSGRLIAHFYDEHGTALAITQLMDVNPDETVSLQKQVVLSGKASRVSLHLVDEAGVDRGALQEVRVLPEENR